MWREQVYMENLVVNKLRHYETTKSVDNVFKELNAFMKQKPSHSVTFKLSESEMRRHLTPVTKANLSNNNNNATSSLIGMVVSGGGGGGSGGGGTSSSNNMRQDSFIQSDMCSKEMDEDYSEILKLKHFTSG